MVQLVLKLVPYALAVAREVFFCEEPVVRAEVAVTAIQPN